MELTNGPWLGVSSERQTVCAFTGCPNPGKPQVCPYDGRRHHHGCIHYKGAIDPHVALREGWCLMCDEHYALLLLGSYVEPSDSSYDPPKVAQ